MNEPPPPPIFSQTLVPLALIAWIAMAGQWSVGGFWAQAIATGMALIALTAAAGHLRSATVEISPAFR